MSNKKVFIFKLSRPFYWSQHLQLIHIDANQTIIRLRDHILYVLDTLSLSSKDIISKIHVKYNFDDQ